jgi:hypothetical protein
MTSGYLELPRRSEEEVALGRLLKAIEESQYAFAGSRSDVWNALVTIQNECAAYNRYIRLRKSSPDPAETDLMASVERCKL